MADAQARQQWAHTSSILAMLANVNRDPKKKPQPFKPADFDPTRQDNQEIAGNVEISALKHMFVDE